MKLFPLKNSGFIALLSIVIMSTVLFVTTLAIAQFGIAGRYFMMDLEQKDSSYKLAEACVNIVQIKVYNDSAYNTNITQIINIDKKLCTIDSVIKNGIKTTAQVTGRDGAATTHLQITFDNNTAEYLSWEELVHF